MTAAAPSRRAFVLLGATLAVFVGLIVVLVVSSVSRPSVHAFAPRALGNGKEPVAGAAAETVTVDARDARVWRYLELDGRARESSPFEPWDLAVRRFDLVSSGVTADLGVVPFESRGHVYVLRTSDGAYVKMQIVSYYCPGPTAGCMTVRIAPVR
jgi:hypothetical protein